MKALPGGCGGVSGIGYAGDLRLGFSFEVSCVFKLYLRYIYGVCVAFLLINDHTGREVFDLPRMNIDGVSGVCGDGRPSMRPSDKGES